VVTRIVARKNGHREWRSKAGFVRLSWTPFGIRYCRRYTGYINARNRVTGHLFQGRFGSVAMDEAHLLAAIRYVSLNPVTAKLVRKARDWPRSSVRAHLAGKDDVLVLVKPVLQRIKGFEDFLQTEADPEIQSRIESGQSIGRPLMEISVLKDLERKLKRPLLPKKRGPKAGSKRKKK